MAEERRGQRVAVAVLGRDASTLVARGARLAARVGARLDVLGFGGTAAGLEVSLTDVPPEVRGDVRTLAGRPIDALVAAAEGYDALVVRAPSAGMFQRLILGDVALQLVSRAPCAVLFAQGTDRVWRAPLQALVGVYLADPGIPFLLAVDWAGRLGAVLDVSLTDPMVTPWVDDVEVRREIATSIDVGREDDRRALDRLIAGLPEGMRGQRRHGEGLPDDVLVDLSADYDLVLVGNRPRPGLTGRLRGSIAEHVVQNARTDVLVLPSRRLIAGTSG